MTTALVTGISGQDGSYLAELLLEKGYRVVGLTRNAERARGGPLAGVVERVSLVQGSLADLEALRRLVAAEAPGEVYNFAGQTRVADAWNDPVTTGEVTALGAHRLLDAVRTAAPRARFLQASSSEMFAPDIAEPLSEDSPMRPASPYGAAKLYAHHVTRQYRESRGLFAVSAILFNHESPRRGEAFVTRKITQGVARIARGEARELRLGDLDVRRDWGFAGDYVRAMWQMLQAPEPEDFVIGTGEAHSVAEFCAAAFAAAGLDWERHVVTDPALYRPADAAVRVADPSRARARLGWTPEVDFRRLVEMMVRHDRAGGRKV